jgi:hypothetical protein
MIRAQHRHELAKLVSAVEGDRIQLTGDAGEYVRAACGGPVLELGCINCRQKLANLEQLNAHLETSAYPTHVIALHCPDHGWETIRQ